MSTKPITPTDAELQSDLNAAAERLRQTRIAAAEGTATPDELAEAEKAHRFAETRITAATEARKNRQHEARKKRARELVTEAKMLHKSAAEQFTLLETNLHKMLTDYLDQAELRQREHRAIHSELVSIYDRDRDALPDGVTAQRWSGAISLNGTSYDAPSGKAVVNEWLRQHHSRRSSQPVSRRKRGER